MTQDNILVSPSTSACPKPGASKACARSARVLNRTGSSLRLSELGDTSVHVARISQSARVTPAPSYSRWAITLAPASWTAGGPTPLFLRVFNSLLCRTQNSPLKTCARSGPAPIRTGVNSAAPRPLIVRHLRKFIGLLSFFLTLNSQRLCAKPTNSYPYWLTLNYS
jgi:hypothetical protein